ncbi:MAG: rhomboid family intramembrane serine protease [Paludibacter sp.]|nr:MAG: rhomboid family intramembrane serine protease [Paludibacter sp.]
MYRKLPPVVKNIIIINVLMFLATAIFPSFLLKFGINFNFIDKFGMHYILSEKFNIIQMFTYMFMHAPFPNFQHILFNMFAVFMFGPILEQVWGARKFLFYYLLVGLGAGIIQQIFWQIEFGSLFSAMNQAIDFNDTTALTPYQDKLSKYFLISGHFDLISTSNILEMKLELQNALLTVGASGSVFGLLLAFGWLFPEERLYLMFIPYPIKARYFVAGYAVIELFLGVANFSGDSVAHFAHLGGMLFGLITMLYWKKQGKLYS